MSEAIRDQARSHIETLLSEFYGPEDIHAWMGFPHRQLGGRIPLDLIAEGRATEVLAVVNLLRDGAWS